MRRKLYSLENGVPLLNSKSARKFLNPTLPFTYKHTVYKRYVIYFCTSLVFHLTHVWKLLSQRADKTVRLWEWHNLTNGSGPSASKSFPPIISVTSKLEQKSTTAIQLEQWAKFQCHNCLQTGSKWEDILAASSYVARQNRQAVKTV